MPWQHDILELQRAAGNAVVTSLLGRSPTAHPVVQRCGDERHAGCPCVEGEAPVAVQRAKIDHRDLTWADFKGPAPKGAFPAATYSAMHRVPRRPKTLTTEEDTGEECALGKKTRTTFTATRALDPASLDAVKAFMWQEKSGARADYKKGLSGRTGKAVTACEHHFTKESARIGKEAAKECAAQVKPCRDAFAEGAESFTLTFGDHEVEVDDVKKCAKGMVKECSKAYASAAEPATYSRSIGTGPTAACPALPEAMEEVEAGEKAACATTFKTAVGDLNKDESERLLAHEQLHFDISHSYAEALRPELVTAAEGLTVEATGCGKPAAVANAKKAYAKLGAVATLEKSWTTREKERDTTQDTYDDDTCHGLNPDKQADWDGKY